MANKTKEMKDYEIIDRLRSEMIDRGVTYRELAKETGIDIKNLNRIINGMVSPRLDTLCRVAQQLGCDVQLNAK